MTQSNPSLLSSLWGTRKGSLDATELVPCALKLHYGAVWTPVYVVYNKSSHVPRRRGHVQAMRHRGCPSKGFRMQNRPVSANTNIFPWLSAFDFIFIQRPMLSKAQLLQEGYLCFLSWHVSTHCYYDPLHFVVELCPHMFMKICLFWTIITRTYTGSLR